jgi:hypothetical protein
VPAVVEFLVGQHDGFPVNRLKAVALDKLNGNHAHQNGRADNAVHMEGLEPEHLLNPKPADDFAFGENDAEQRAQHQVFEIFHMQ